MNVVSWDGGGLGTDLDVLVQVLTRIGCRFDIKARRHRHPRHWLHSKLMTAKVFMMQAVTRVTGRRWYDVNLFIESVFPEYLPLARVNCLIPNPEWFRPEQRTFVDRLDLLLCRTQDGISALAELPVPSRLLGFTSLDRSDASTRHPDRLRCLHIAGASDLKGTEAVIDVWSRHPEWPELVVVRRSLGYGGPLPPTPPHPNIRYETSYLSAVALRELQNACAVHVIPSEAEGYGHVIGEAMSCGAVVVTTDAPPMNELVTPERGVLVRVARSEPMRLGTRHFVDLLDLESKLQKVFAMDPTERILLGRNARAWYEGQDRRFEASLCALLAEVTMERGS